MSKGPQKLTGEMLAFPKPALVAPPPVAREHFITAMGRAVTSVNVVTTLGAAGRYGVTVSAFSSVSADPPMVLVCINREGRACEAVRRNRVFCVNVLGDAHEEISRVFAGQSPVPEEGRFGCANWTRLETGAPALEGALAVFDCRVDSSHEYGTHTVFIGLVLEARHGDGLPLLYTQRSYGTPNLGPR
jgi:flavin reductase (DIM6/NTAB) family NADH-FMN oxidoreductase RutF